MFRPAKTKWHLYKHASRRIRQRYGVWIEEPEWNRMNRDIQQGKAQFLGRESHSRSHWMIDGYLIAVYDNKRQGIATFLPPEAINNYIPIGSFNPRKWREETGDLD